MFCYIRSYIMLRIFPAKIPVVFSGIPSRIAAGVSPRLPTEFCEGFLRNLFLESHWEFLLRFFHWFLPGFFLACFRYFFRELFWNFSWLFTKIPSLISLGDVSRNFVRIIVYDCYFLRLLLSKTYLANFVKTLSGFLMIRYFF